MADQQVGSIYVKVGARTEEFKKGIKEASSVLEKSSRKMMATGAQLSLGLTAPLTLIGKESVSEFRKFDKAMIESTAIMGNVSADMKKKMTDLAQNLAMQTNKTQEELAKSYYYLASAGLDAEASLKTLPSITRFATAGIMDMQKASTVLIDTQRALGLTTGDTNKDLMEMNRISDLLVGANQLANASVTDYANALTNKTASALKITNKELEEGIAVLTGFAEAGIKGQRAGTYFDIVMRELKTKAISNSEAFDKMGISVYGSNGQMLKTYEIIGQLEKRFDGLTDKQKQQALMDLGFQARSIFAIQTLLGRSEAMEKNYNALKKFGGISQEVADKNLSSLDAKLKIIGSKFDFIQTDIGQKLVPAFDTLNVSLDYAIQLWKTLDEETKQWIVSIGAVAAALGPVLGFMGTLGYLIPLLGKGIAMLALLSAKLLLVGASLAAIVAVFDYFSSMEDVGSKFTIMVTEWEGALKRFGLEFVFLMKEMNLELENFATFVKDKFLDNADVIIASVKMAWSAIVDTIKEDWRFIQGLLGMDVPEESSQSQNKSYSKKVLTERYGLGDQLGKVSKEEMVEDLVSINFLSDKELKAALYLIDMYYSTVEESVKQGNDLKSKIEQRDAERQEKLTQKQITLEQEKTQAIVSMYEDITKEIDKAAMKINPETDLTFFEHVENRVDQFKDKFFSFSEEMTSKVTEANKNILRDTQTTYKKSEDAVKGFGDEVEQVTGKAYNEFSLFGKKSEDIAKGIQGGFESAFENMFNSLLDGTASASEAFQALGEELLKVVLQQALIKPMASSLAGGGSTDGTGGGVGAVMSGISSIIGLFAADGAVFNGTNYYADGGVFGDGGVMTSPTPFAMPGGQMGIAGEAGPEAAVPLKRGRDGKLGINAEGLGQTKIVKQNFYIQTQDADSFKRSEKQIRSKFSKGN